MDVLQTSTNVLAMCVAATPGRVKTYLVATVAPVLPALSSKAEPASVKSHNSYFKVNYFILQ